MKIPTLAKLKWTMFRRCDETCQSWSLFQITHFHEGRDSRWGWSNNKKKFLVADDEEVRRQEELYK